MLPACVSFSAHTTDDMLVKEGTAIPEAFERWSHRHHINVRLSPALSDPHTPALLLPELYSSSPSLHLFRHFGSVQPRTEAEDVF